MKSFVAIGGKPLWRSGVFPPLLRSPGSSIDRLWRREEQPSRWGSGFAPCYPLKDLREILRGEGKTVAVLARPAFFLGYTLQGLREIVCGEGGPALVLERVSFPFATLTGVFAESLVARGKTAAVFARQSVPRYPSPRYQQRGRAPMADP